MSYDEVRLVYSDDPARRAEAKAQTWRPRYQPPDPPATTVRATATTTSMGNPVSADHQLIDLAADPREGLRGIPLVGAGPGAIAHTQPERQTIWSLTRFQHLALLFVSGNGQATGACLTPSYP